MLSCFSHVRHSTTVWTTACQDPLSMGISSHKHWSGLPCPSPGDLLNPGIKSMSFMSPSLAGRFCTSSTTWGAQYICINIYINIYYSSDSLLSEAIRDTECNSPCPAAGPCCLSPLCVVVCSR